MDKIDTFFVGAVCGGLLFMLIWSIISWDEPTPIDVYRGRTTLEITYRDSIPIDSVVVFK